MEKIKSDDFSVTTLLHRFTLSFFFLCFRQWFKAWKLDKLNNLGYVSSSVWFVSNFAYLLWLHFSKTIALLFMIFFCVIRYSFRPSFGYDRQIVVDNILILSRGRRRNYVKHKRQSQGLGLRHAIKCRQLQMKGYSRWGFEAPYTNYSYTTKTALVTSSLDYSYKACLAELHLWGECLRGPIFCL